MKSIPTKLFWIIHELCITGKQSRIETQQVSKYVITRHVKARNPFLPPRFAPRHPSRTLVLRYRDFALLISLIRKNILLIQRSVRFFVLPLWENRITGLNIDSNQKYFVSVVNILLNKSPSCSILFNVRAQYMVVLMFIKNEARICTHIKNLY